jgi:transposase
MERQAYPGDVSDDEWAFVAPYLTLMKEEAAQREHSQREVFNGLFNGLRYIVRSGEAWRMMPHDLPPWYRVYQQTQRWIAGGVFEAIVDDLRMLLRVAAGHKAHPSAVIMDGRTMQSSPESGARAGFDGHKKRRGSKVHMVVDTLGLLLTLHVTPANEQERAQVGLLAQQVQDITGDNVEIAFVDEGYTGPQARSDAAQHGIHLEVVKLPQAKRGFVLLPRRWVVERSFSWMARLRRLARDYERLPETLVGLHYLAFAFLMLARFVHLALQTKPISA